MPPCAPVLQLEERQADADPSPPEVELTHVAEDGFDDQHDDPPGGVDDNLPMIGLGRGPCDEGVVRAAAEGPGCAAYARPWVLTATILGSSMAFIDTSVVNV